MTLFVIVTAQWDWSQKSETEKWDWSQKNETESSIGVRFRPSRKIGPVRLEWDCGDMAVARQLAKDVQKEIAALLEKHGKGYDWTPLREQYPDVPKATFYRWVKKIEASGVPSQNALRKAKKRASTQAKRNGPEKAKEKAVKAVSKQLPAVPTGQEVGALGLDEIANRLRSCMGHAERLIAHSENKEGGIDDADLLLKSSEHLRRTIDTAAKLMNLLWDIERTERLHKVIFERLRERDPVIVQLIVEDLRALNLSLGVEV